MARLLDPKKKSEAQFPFEYRNSANTDVRKTWERAKKEQQENLAERLHKVIDVKRGKR